jgi:taurine dioxygenase
MSGARFSIYPLSVGAEVIGLARGSEEDQAVKAGLYEAWLEYGILLFRNVDSIERHLAISRCFGELEMHPMPQVRYAGNPYLIEIGKDPVRYVYEDQYVRVNRIPWHRDTAYTPDICKGAMLRMLEAPEHEGETLLADTAKAYDDLPADLKALLEGLEYKATLRTDHVAQTRPGALWKTVRREDGTVDDDALSKPYPPVVHPAVLTHPESGRKCIFLSPTYVDFFLGLAPEDSQALLLRLVDHMLQPQYVYAHRWTVNDAIVWDNRRFMHAGNGNRPEERRYGLRTTLAGPTRTGRYFDPQAKAPATTLAD